MTVLIYGAYGYTGELVSREAVTAGLEPVLAGRREAPLSDLAGELGLEYRVADLEELERILKDITVCLHCAGPFVDTHEPAVEACLATGTHYLDINGETPAFEGVRARDKRAHEEGITLLPGAGFEVVPSDCLAAKLVDRLPGAERLTLAFPGFDEVSPGTASTGGRLLGEGVHIREEGRLRTVTYGSRTRRIDLGVGNGPQVMGVFPFGDVVTAYHTTDIPNIEVYGPDVLGLGPTGQRVLGALQPVFRSDIVQRALVSLGGVIGDGPDAERRATGSDYFWGEVTDGERRVTGRVHTSESYGFTAESMVELAQRVLDRQTQSGFQTPAGAFGADLVTDIDDGRFEAIEESPLEQGR